MTRDEAKKTLQLYRPGTTDAEDSEIAEALALAKQDTELSHWLEQHCAQHEILRAKIRKIPVPAGLKEQIVSERFKQTAPVGSIHKQVDLRRGLTLLVMAMAVLVLIGWVTGVFWQSSPDDNTFANYRSRMVTTALRSYAMDFQSPDLKQIQLYLAQQKVVENYQLPAGLQKVHVNGCAIAGWQDTKGAMICFHTGKPLPPGERNDLWLFVIDCAAVKNAPLNSSPQFAKVNKLTTATWTQGDKLYLLGTVGDEQTIRQWL